MPPCHAVVFSHGQANRPQATRQDGQELHARCLLGGIMGKPWDSGVAAAVAGAPGCWNKHRHWAIGPSSRPHGPRMRCAPLRASRPNPLTPPFSWVGCASRSAFPLDHASMMSSSPNPKSIHQRSTTPPPKDPVTSICRRASTAKQHRSARARAGQKRPRPLGHLDICPLWLAAGSQQPMLRPHHAALPARRSGPIG